MCSPLPNIVDHSCSELRRDFPKKGLEAYRSSQVIHWIYQKGVYSFDQMINLPKVSRELLAKHYSINLGKVIESQDSRKDKSRKILIEYFDGNTIETVLIPRSKRLSVCVSTQVGCKFHCTFCASGQFGFVRNLTTAEIIAQVLHAKSMSKKPITNVIFMGIGEGLDNYKPMLRAIRLLTNPDHFGISQRKITISTCGLVPAILKLSDEKIHLELSVSLHAVDDYLRSQIMPINRKYTVKDILNACQIFTKKTKREVTFEYLLIDGFNSSPKHAKDLAKALKEMKCMVNLIPLNPVKDFAFKRPRPNKVELFRQVLDRARVKNTLRYSSGSDIEASCGQLRSKKVKSNLSSRE